MTVRSLDHFPKGFHGDAYLRKLVNALALNSNVFIETGSNVGSSLRDIAHQFPELECFSCEPDLAAFGAAKRHAVTRPGVHLFNETSQDFMKRFEESYAALFEQPLLAWLDAHDHGFEWPLREEVAFLTKKFTRGAILIDDFRVPGRPEFGWDQYGDQHCSFEFIESSIQDGIAWRLSYPSYSEHTSEWHPLRGWGLLQFAPSLAEIPKMSAFLPDVCHEDRAHDPKGAGAPTEAADSSSPPAAEELEAHINTLLEKLKSQVHDPLLWNDLGVCLALNGDVREGLFSLGQALSIDPSHPDASANYLAIVQAQRPEGNLPRPVSPGASGHMVARDPYQDLKSLVEVSEPLIVDGGAGRGDTVAKLRASFPQGIINAFEPIPEVAEALRDRFVADPGVVVSACALASSERPISFPVCGSEDISSKLPPSEITKRDLGEAAEIARTVQTLQRRLDKALPRPADILKLDLQGFEMEALEGAGSTLAHARAIMTKVDFVPLFEGQPLYGEVDAFLRQRGFRLFNLYGLGTGTDGQLTSGEAIYVNTRYYS